MCTAAEGQGSWFLPFNKGWNDGAGNPPNPDGLKTDYLWKRVLTPRGLTDILENYAQIVEEKDARTGKKKRKQVWPALPPARRGAEAAGRRARARRGQRYLIQHSAGSGKSNSIAWLAHQLIGLKRDDEGVRLDHRRHRPAHPRPADPRRPSSSSCQVGATVGHAEHSGDLRKFIEEGKKIIISTVQKFPFILDEIGTEGGKTFAIIIDEAHSSQGGKTSAAMSPGAAGGATRTDPEDTVNEDRINRIMEARKMLPNASYFAFTATPKNKTLEMFGEPLPPEPRARSSTGPSTATR